MRRGILRPLSEAPVGDCVSRSIDDERLLTLVTCTPASGGHFLLTYLKMFPTIKMTRNSPAAVPSPRSTAMALRLDSVCWPHLARPQALRAAMSTRSSGGIKIHTARPSRSEEHT